MDFVEDLIDSYVDEFLALCLIFSGAIMMTFGPVYGGLLMYGGLFIGIVGIIWFLIPDPEDDQPS